MSVRRFDLEAGGTSFSFKSETESKIGFWLSKYPEGKKRSAVIPLLWLAQKDNAGWLSEPAMRAVAERLEMAYIRVYEVATFYTMFRLQPVGEWHVQLCGTTPCMLRGSETLKKVCERKIGKIGAVSANGKLSWEEVECLGACVNAPMVQINDYYYEDLSEESFTKVLNDLEAGKQVEPGPQVDRITSAPIGGLTSLLDETLYDGSRAKSLSSIPNAPVPEPSEPVEKARPKDNAGQPNEASKEISGAASKAKVETAGEKSVNSTVGEGAPKAGFGKTKSFDRSRKSTASLGGAGASKSASAAMPTLNDERRPEALAEPRENEKDDLKRVSGIGPKIEGVLNKLGIFHFDQIARWNRDNVAWVDGYLSFRGRIDREQWISQAKVLASGGDTQFSSRTTGVKKDEG